MKRKNFYKEFECPDGSIKRIRIWPEIDNDYNNAKKVPIIDNEDDNNELDAFFDSIVEPYIPKEEETQKERQARYNAKYKENGKQKEWIARNNAKRKANGKQKEDTIKYKENGKQKEWSVRNNAKRKANGKQKEATAKNKENGKTKEKNDRNNAKYKENGKQKEWNDRKNAKNNAKNSAKKKQKLKEEFYEYLRQHDRGEEILTDDKYEEIIKTIHEEHPEFDSTMRDDGGYLGLTRQALKDEYLRWLSTRGRWMKNSSNYTRGQTYSKNRPTLTYPDGSHVTQKEAEEQFGFYGVVLFETPYLEQAATVEEMLQRHYQFEVGLALGKRLWRHPGMGSKYVLKQEPERIYKVFHTSSVYLQEAIKKGELVVQK